MTDKMTGQANKFIEKHKLTAREAEVFKCLLRGVTRVKDLSLELGVSPRTLNNHFDNIFSKTVTNSKTDLLSRFIMDVTQEVRDCSFYIKQPRVLVVDDEPEICEILAHGLKRRGIKVQTACDPKTVVEKVRINDFDVILMDVRMPGFDGFLLSRELKQTFPFSPAIVFISGHATDKGVDELHALGAAAFFSKPVDINAVFQTIMEYFIESEVDRNRYLRISESIPIVIESQLDLSIENIGYGGVYIPLSDSVIAGQSELFQVGKTLSFQFRLDEHPPISAVGEIVWRRDKPKDQLAPGVGVKFLNINEEAQLHVREYVRLHHILSFIPLGKSA